MEHTNKKSKDPITKKKNISKMGIVFVLVGAICIVISYTLFNPDSSGSLAMGVLGGAIIGSGVAHLLMKTNC